MENKELTYTECKDIIKTNSTRNCTFVRMINIADEVNNRSSELKITTKDEFEQACANVDLVEIEVETTGNVAIYETVSALINMINDGQIPNGGVQLSDEQTAALIEGAQAIVDSL